MGQWDIKFNKAVARVRHPVIFYDGLCGLCGFFVKWVLKKDLTKIFYFSSLQGKLAQLIWAKELGPESASALDTVILQYNGVTYTKSDAVFMIFSKLPMPWKGIGKLGLGFLVIPGFRYLSNIGYSVVAHLRYLIFGKYDICPLPSFKHKSRFID